MSLSFAPRVRVHFVPAPHTNWLQIDLMLQKSAMTCMYVRVQDRRILMCGEAENPVSNTSNAASVDLFTRRRLGRVLTLAAL